MALNFLQCFIPAWGPIDLRVVALWTPLTLQMHPFVMNRAPLLMRRAVTVILAAAPLTSLGAMMRRTWSVVRHILIFLS